MSLNSPFYVDKDLVQPRISADIRNSVLPLISLNESSIQKATPRNVGSSPNITSNLFNLREAPSFGSLGGGASTGGPSRRPNDGPRSWRDEHPEEYDANVQKRKDEETARKTRVADNTRRSKEDETLAYNTANPNSSLSMTNGIANDTAENRQQLRQFRTQRDLTRQTDQISAIIDRTSKQDPSTLSARDAGALALAKIQMKGGDMSNPTAGLEARVRSKVAGMQGKNVLSPELSGSGNQMQDDIDALAAAKKTPEEAAQDAAARTTATARSKAYFDADTKSTFDVSREATKRDVAQRDLQNRADAAQQAADRKEKMQGVKISGTNMTYGEFKSNTGRDYDATNKDDSSLVIRQAGAMGGRYSSAEARDLAGSTDSMINMQRNASDARVAEGGRLTRQVDRSAQEKSDFDNNPTIRAQQIAKDKASVMPQVMAQINAETSKQNRLEAEGRALAAGDKAKIAAAKSAELKSSLEKNSIRIPSKTYVEPGAMGPPKPTIPFMLGGTEQRPAKQPFLPTLTGGDNAQNAAGRAEEKAKRQKADAMFVNGKMNPEYQKDLDMASGKISNKLYGNQTGYPLGDESLVTIPQDEFSDVNVIGDKINDLDLENTSHNLVQDTINNRANFIREKARREAETTRSKRLEAQKQKAEAEKQTKLQTAEDERQQREYEMQRSSPPPSLLSDINPNEGPRPEFNTPPSEYGPSLLGDIMQSGASTAPGTSSTSRPAVAPGSPKDIEDQLKRLRGQ